MTDGRHSRGVQAGGSGGGENVLLWICSGVGDQGAWGHGGSLWGKSRVSKEPATSTALTHGEEDSRAKDQEAAQLARKKNNRREKVGEVPGKNHRSQGQGFIVKGAREGQGYMRPSWGAQNRGTLAERGG